MDILFPVKDISRDAIERMKICLKSLETNTEKYRICISDTSEVSQKNVLDDFIKEGYGYHYEKCTGLFNRSRTINNGVRCLVKSNPFMVMDIDIIVPSDFVRKMIAYYNEKKTCVIGNMAYLHKGHKATHLWEELCGSPIIYTFNCGFLICNLELFMKINGFDEKYKGYGAEDEDFNLRIKKATGGNMRMLKNMEMTCWHLYHKRVGDDCPAIWQANIDRYKSRLPLYESGALKVDDIEGARQ